MRVLLKPHVRLNPLDRTDYTFDGDVVRLTVFHADEEVQEQSFEYDFTGMPDGEIDDSDEFLWSAKKVDGVLYVELFNYVLAEEHKDADWFDTNEVKPK